jgi:hypothetical protein
MRFPGVGASADGLAPRARRFLAARHRWRHSLVVGTCTRRCSRCAASIAPERPVRLQAQIAQLTVSGLRVAVRFAIGDTSVSVRGEVISAPPFGVGKNAF